MGSREASVAKEASEAFAAFIGPVVNKVLMQASTASAVYTDLPFDEDDSPSIPLDLYNEGQGYVTTWSQSVAGGLPTSAVEGFSEMKVSTYRLDSAVSFLKRYARRGRLDVVSKAVERMSNEVLVKQERNAWAVLLKALAESGNVVGVNETTVAFTLTHLNRLITAMKRKNTSYAGGSTTDAYSLTDLFVSPEVKQDIRSFAYNPVTNESTDLPAGVREEIYRGAGTQEIYGVTIHDLIELGKGQKYQTLFSEFYSTNWDAANNELIIGLDLTKDAFVRPVARQAESGGTFTAIPDDQFLARADKIGFYGFLEEGRACIDARAIAGVNIY
ncbi:hypothetical protein EBR43_13425 [bacterium]|nr:hypothetical protein [bacterium]